VLDLSGAAGEGGLPEVRSLDQILSFEGDDPRFPKMQETWRAFGPEMGGQVRDVLDGGRSSAEVAYGVGVIVHNYFRTRGITLTSYELRALAAELVDRREPPPTVAEDVAVAAPEEPPQQEKAEVAEIEVKETTDELVSFTGKEAAADAPWAGEDTLARVPAVAEAAFASPPSKLVSLVGRETASFDRLLVKVVEIAAPALGASVGGRVDRGRALRAIDAAIEGVLKAEDGTLADDVHRRLALAALSEICGLGPIERLWADRSIRAIFVDGPDSIYVEREGGREPAPETFRSNAHLLETARRLARPRSGGVVEFQLRDGGNGVVIFPPAAPAGPVLMVRRGDPGNATLDRLIASELIDRRLAALLRVAARARLNVLIVGSEGSGKTALLAAVARDMAASRVVTLARHRAFRWPSSTKVELVAQPGDGAAYSSLMAAGLRLQPDLLVLDSLQIAEASALAERLERGSRGTFAALRPDSLAALLVREADLMVRLGRSRDGLFRVQSVEDRAGTAVFVHEDGRFQQLTNAPAFAETMRQAGFGDALSSIFR
jgi:Flp pilus assembly CpaF family ATPase